MFDIRCIQINIRNAYSENINWEKYKDNFLDTCCIPFKRAGRPKRSLRVRKRASNVY